MESKPSKNSSHVTKTASKAWSLVVAGYSTAAVALMAFLTINGASGVPAVAIILTTGLVVIGFLLPIAGMLQLRRGFGSIKRAARYGFAMQAFGLLGLLFGVVIVVAAPSFSSYIIGAVFVITASVSAIGGAILSRVHFMSVSSSNNLAVWYLILGTTLIFSGVGLIVASNIGLEFFVSSVENTIYVDIGAAVSACGSVLAAYSFFSLYNHD